VNVGDLPAVDVALDAGVLLEVADIAPPLVKEGVGPENPNCTGFVGEGILVIIRRAPIPYTDDCGLLFNEERNGRNIPAAAVVCLRNIL
jgi:hypothetical protein